MEYLKQGAWTLILIVAVVLAGCESAPKKQTGAAIGALAGGIIGKQIGKGTGNTAATVAGTLIGAYIGMRIGEELDRRDREEANRALETTPTQKAYRWTNPDTGRRYEVIPVGTHDGAQGPCRDFVGKVTIDGREETVRGTACRQPDGIWRTVQQER